MFFHAKNGTVKLRDAHMDYIRFGTGDKVLIMLPGLGDGLRSVKGTALPMAFMYRKFAKHYTVYAFSRKEPLPYGYTTRHMAEDQKKVMDELGIRKAHVLGVSMGGMIAQHLAINYPQAVERLVLAVTCPEPNATLIQSVSEWIELANRSDHTAFMDGNVKRIYSDSYYRKNKWLIPLIGKLSKPKSYDRFLVQANACLTHNTLEELRRISCPTLIIGGEKDRALSPEGSRVLARNIHEARLHMYPNYGHGLYEEAGDFNDMVLKFLKQS